MQYKNEKNSKHTQEKRCIQAVVTASVGDMLKLLLLPVFAIKSCFIATFFVSID